MRGEMGKNESAAAAGRVAASTADSEIATKKAENAVKTWENSIQSLEYASKASPLEAQQHWDKVSHPPILQIKRIDSNNSVLL
jgi:Tfp pilus assembly protein PilX